MIRKPALPLAIAAWIAPAIGQAQLIVTPTGDLPVIQQVQLLFSLVTHYSHIGDRVNFYNTKGQPAGNAQYAVPHLVCDPLITLYNPHPTPLTLNSARVRIWDPPVGFRFQKNGVYLRNDYAAGSFLGLARLQIANEFNSNARKSFTLRLTTPRSTGQPGDPIVLQPGETRLFSAWVETNWTWSLETAGGYVSRQFFDWDTNSDLSNRDKRTNNSMGVECLGWGSGPPGNWDPRAGFQWDYLASSIRPANTRYTFEEQNNWGQGWVAIKLTDKVTVESKALRTFPDTGSAGADPDFRISLLAGRSPDPTRDVYQQFSFDADAIHPAPGDSGVVSRMYRVGDLLQTPNELNPGGKSPFAVLTAIARRESLASGALEDVGLFDGDQHYETRFDEVADFYSLDLFGHTQTYFRYLATARPIDVQRSADGRVNLTVASPAGVSGWTVRGGTSPDAMVDDLTSQADIVPLPTHYVGAKLDRVSIDASSVGDRYFVQLVEPTP